MDLNLFEDVKINNDFTEKGTRLLDTYTQALPVMVGGVFINKFIEELRSKLKIMQSQGEGMKKQDNELDEYNLYEKKKVFLDNKSRNGNSLAWVMDKDSVCTSEAGDGGPISINEMELVQDVEVGKVYEKIDGKYIYNDEITKELNNIRAE